MERQQYPEFEVAAITNKASIHRGSVRVTAALFRGSVVLMVAQQQMLNAAL
ncbi:hypothetical protein OK016_11770 [Vibrio chagasii]|nr:hypothetical protein [Vibrio chagasii]